MKKKYIIVLIIAICAALTIGIAALAGYDSDAMRAGAAYR